MIIEGKNIQFRLVEETDANFILMLRLDESKSKFISKVDHDIQKQIEWIREYKTRENNKTEYYFIIEDKNGERHGCVRLYDFRGDSFCWGSWILRNGSPSYMAIESALLVYEYAFFSLCFKKSHFDVRKGNDKVIAFHTRFGAKIVNEDQLDFYFIFTKEDYKKTKIKYIKYLADNSKIGLCT